MVRRFFEWPDNWLLPEFATHIGFFLGLIFLAHLIRQRRSPASTMAWLLVILFLPYLGVPLYLMLGGRKMSRMARRKPRVYERAGLQNPRSIEGHQGTERFLMSYGVPPAREGNRVELLTRGEDAFRRLVELIDSATSSIHITTYILGRGRVGRELVEHLARRAAGGVSVRLLLDSVGSRRVRRRDLARLLESGARVAYFMPVLHVPFRGRANLRNHRKIVVVDGRIALTGGMNFAWPYMGPGPDDGLWRDLSAVIVGPSVADLDALFFSDWEFATGEDLRKMPPDGEDGERAGPAPPPVAGIAGASSTVQVVASGPDVQDDPLYETLVSLIFAASKRIWIVTPYFVPDEMLVRSLNLAARRGVDIRLIVPKRSNHLSTDLARESYLRELHESGGKVYLHQPVMMHAKAVLFDDNLAVIGSANMDNRSLFLNYEVALFLYSRECVADLAEWALRLQFDSERELPQPGWLRELAESVVRLLSPLL
ncbi:putative cardiolipin synthase YwiE [Aquisphaera giovannonii]|uniref:Cardiolipin synthase n=1 Tax=Aquisphaera giovannonii TaxID=406548 RepID=A0A5B9W0S5_9BACT|nr:cardiolipin synthase [Aquisphaera giovannonii]QEH33869.1 putative cardiolipin synthase YwiE [Aquisphaera giovannonii]